MNGKKTYFAAAATVLGAVSAALAGTLTWPEALAIIVPAILAVTIRHGVTTEIQKATS